MTTTFKIYRYCRDDVVRLALTRPDEITVDLGPSAPGDLTTLLESPDPIAELTARVPIGAAQLDPGRLELLPPIDHHEVWAAGVTYLRSKSARMDESDFSATAYDRVYDAERPELFFKSLPQKVVGPGSAVGIRHDSRWNVPEPELALVLNSRGRIVAYTIGNDMSSRDIEGANLLYLPQAKTYAKSCSLGPCLLLGVTESNARAWRISLDIDRAGSVVFSGQTTIDQIKRPFDELVDFLMRCQSFPNGVVLLTGTGVVPPNDFSLQPNDIVRIQVDAIGTLTNRVIDV
jgi:2-dehydro-3-deoxy-D-arabinonate dehydratase